MLAACGGSTATRTTQTGGVTTGGTGTGHGGASREQPTTTAMVRAVETTPMPTCEAGDLHALATLTDGVAAQPAIASHEGGALVAFVIASPRDGAHQLMVAAVDAHGALRGNTTHVDTGANPAHPAIAAQGEGYVLVWREGAPGQERIVGRRVAADGAVNNASIAFDGIAAGWLGAPAIAVSGDALALALVRHSAHPDDPDARRGDRLEWVRGSEHGAVGAPDAGEFEAERPAQWVVANGQLRLFATTMAHAMRAGGGRDLVEVALDPSASMHLSLTAGNVAAPRVFASERGPIATWRASVTAHDTAIRAWPLAGDVPPLTLATFRGAHDAEAALLPLGEHLLGAFTLSALADDDGGTLNVSVLTDAGQPVGRQPLLVSSLVRSASVIAATTGEGHLFVLEGRAENGRDGVLGIAPIQCSIANHADPLQIPPAGLVQRLASLDEPARQLAQPIGACTVAGAPQTAFTHRVERGDVVADSDERLVSLGASTVVFAVVREQDGGARHLAARSLDARGTLGAASSAVEHASRILAAGRSGAVAVALVETRAPDAAHNDAAAHLAVLTAGANGRLSAPAAIPLVAATSAVLADDGRALFVAAASDRASGDHGLFRVPLANGRPGAPVLVAALAPGDEVLDAMRGAHDTPVLLARPDELGAPISRSLSIVNIPDAPAAATRQAQRMDPFADPRGHGRGPAWLARSDRGPIVVYAEGNYLRAADLDHGAIRHPHSVLAAHEAGGAPLVRAERSGDASWFAVASGLPADVAHVIAPVSLVSLSRRGEVRVATSTIAADDRMIAGRVSLTRAGDRLVLGYAQPAGDTAANWRVVTITCREGAAPAAASAAPASSSPPPNAPASTQPASNGGR